MGKVGTGSDETCGEKLHCSRKEQGQGKDSQLAGDSEWLYLGVAWIYNRYVSE